MAQKFIHYDKKNGVAYASVYTPQKVNGKKTNNPEYLGRVINKEKGIYQSRARGVFFYNIEDGYADGNFLLPGVEEKLILDFGDIHALYEILKKTGYLKVFKAILPVESDSLLSLIGYKVLGSTANCYAFDWWEGSYARILFPNANIKSQRLSEFLSKLGDEGVQRHFFKQYLTHLKIGNSPRGILIDSTGLPNDIHFPLAALNTHGGETNREARLILVIDRSINMPLYFRYNAGNIVDVTTLKATIDELAMQGVNTEFAIVDAGYYSEKNVKSLYGDDIAFLTRLIPNRKLYKNLVAEHIDDLLQAKYMLIHNGRLLYIKQVSIDLFGYAGYAYIAVDYERRNSEISEYVKKAIEEGETHEEIDAKMRTKGVFILISSENAATNEILPLYYTRQAVEQIFDINKNNIDLLPLRTHSEETFRGHLMLAFMSSVAYLLVSKYLKESIFNPIGAFTILRNLKCKVYDQKILVKEPTKKMKDIAEILDFKLPSLI